MQNLSTNIRQKMKQRRLTVKALADIAGVKVSTINNLTAGRSKNPTLKNLRAICKALNCTISELTEEDKVVGGSSEESYANTWNPQLYAETILAVGKLLSPQKDPLKKMHIHKTIEDVYFYSLRKNRGKVDTYFAEWKLGDTFSRKGHL